MSHLERLKRSLKRGNEENESITNKDIGYEKNEINEKRVVCGCDPLPSQKDSGALAQGGVGPKYEPCANCRYTWRCKLCGGCRYCRVPG
jgi:hypothetical protein